MDTLWTYQENTDTETYRRTFGPDARGYVSRYTVNSGAFAWQAWRGEFVISGSKPTAGAAMTKAEQAMALPVSEFNALVAQSLLAERDGITDKLARLGYTDAPRASHYRGYTEGFEAARAAILDKLESLKIASAQVPA